ncbi:MAG: hypothetical protein WDO19_32550 [Bacteroidota bacterium]
MAILIITSRELVFLAAIWVAVVSSIYAAIANFSYIWIGMKGRLKLSGGSITHFGFCIDAGGYSYFVCEKRSVIT